MKKRLLLYMFLCCAFGLYAQGQMQIHGTVSSSNGNGALAGVNVIIKGTSTGTATDADGKFTLLAKEKDVITFSFIGFRQKEMTITNQTVLTVLMDEDVATLGEVTIVSTGYQQLPKERSNGSFVQVDQQLINRRVSTDIITRLEDVTSGLVFNRNMEENKNDISIRGMSTINSQSQPLIVIDNFPYEGDLRTLNPNDVESITILKDAAAASIWGARAGNGVIVITTKKGQFGQPLKVAFNSNITITDRPDLHYASRMSSADMIENERRLFENGYYASAESSVSAPITPAVELMIAHRDGLIDDNTFASQLNQLSGYDNRDDYENYLYRKGVNQQYALSVNGGSQAHRFFASVGWDKNNDNLVNNGYDRVTINFNNTWSAFHDKLTVAAGLYYSNSRTVTNNDGPASLLYNTVYPMYPYARLKDDSGNHLPVIASYKQSFIDQAQADGLLDWNLVPLDELSRRDNTSSLADYRINTSINYAIIEGLNASMLYQYWNGDMEASDLRKADSYFVRNLINKYSKVETGGNITRAIPDGAIVDKSITSTENHAFRGQLNFSRTWGQHGVSALAGYEVREQKSNSASFRNYGYNEELATVVPVNYTSFFDQYDFPGFIAQIPFVNSFAALNDRFISYYGNATYSFRKRYSISGSVRKDQSNLFGVRANQRGVPLWSAGLGWTISDEGFYKSTILPYLKLRTTYGVNGNINKRSTAFTTAFNLGADPNTGLPYSVITNPPNPNLKWEKVETFNIGVDFETKNRRLNGSLEFFAKKGLDLIGTVPYAPATGITSFTGNTASMKSNGLDIILNTLNIDRQVKWNTTLLLSHIKEKITDYETVPRVPILLSDGSGSVGRIAPYEGKPLYGIYSYAWAGLDPQTGDPRSYLEGVPSTDYTAILTAATPESLIYHGSARPTTFGSIRNTLTWKNISLSFNVSYRLGYYVRRNSVAYENILMGLVTHGDYANRWKQPGDEAFTNVPSIPSQVNTNRENIYRYSEVLVEKGDHIRLQDVNLTYTLDHSVVEKLPVSRIEFYSYVNNVAMLWKATSGNLDPDYQQLKPSRSIAFGVRIDF